MVHYRTHDFVWSPERAAPVTAIELVVSGTWQKQDSAGVYIERLTNPYQLAVYFRTTRPRPVMVTNIRLVGKQSGMVITPDLSVAEPIGDGNFDEVVTATEVVLPYEDYDVQLQVRSGTGAGAVETRVSGTLKTRFSHGAKLRIWERLMSV